MAFIGRQQELAALEERYASGHFEFCVMYGRRRVGKTTLINRFVQGKPTVFFSAMQASVQENLEVFSATLMEALSSGTTKAVFSSFGDAFAQFFEHAADQRLVLVIDEYPYLVQSYPAVSSLLQHLVDRHQANSLAFIILNGSSMTQMSEEFFTNNRPLYGRKTFQMKVRPFGFFEMREYFSQTDPLRLPYLYAIYGGIPKYFEYYREELSLRQNIITDFLSIGAPLLEEPDAVLKKEVREPTVYNTLFAAIARGVHKYSELSSKSNLASGNISRYLETLVFLNLVRREVPVYTNEKKKALYLIDDNMFRFWYRFVARSLSLVNSNRPELAYKAVEEGLEQFMSEAFERICLEYLWRVDGADKLPFVFTEAGRWWGGNPLAQKESEIDILAHDGAKSALFCECKWSSRKVGEDVLEELAAKTLLPQFSALSKKHLALFSRSGFTQRCQKAAAAQGNVVLFSLEDIIGV
ncbi:MAG: ATP-binding protein [Coriobacteriales bacterium]|jgi:AAA+ ATPase superfamily predicted ATPase|nr:ATP-binding protein [Coriobacteriales bacterium]